MRLGRGGGLGWGGGEGPGGAYVLLRGMVGSDVGCDWAIVGGGKKVGSRR